jgi:hypothetical protein
MEVREYIKWVDKGRGKAVSINGHNELNQVVSSPNIFQYSENC